MTVRIAHYSDIHYTLSPLSRPLVDLGGKRLAGTLNYYLGGRGRRFLKVEERIQKLLDDVDEQKVDHAICTGDLTAVAFREEFEGCSRIYADRLSHPEKHTVIPGNHDRYTVQAVEERFFERYFQPLCGGEGAAFPMLKRATPGVQLLLLDVSRPTSLTDSSGHAGERQLARAKEILTDAALKHEFVILCIHYGLLRKDGSRDKPGHRIRDDEAVLALIDRDDVSLDVVIHGHMHAHYSVRSRRRQIICAGSATDLHHPCGYNVYDIDLDARALTIHRRGWNDAVGRYVAALT